MIGKEEILKKLDSFFDSVYSNKELEESYYSVMSKKRSMNRGRFNGYVFHMIDINKMTDEEIYWFASYEKTGIDVKEYFSPEEQKRYSKSKVVIKKPQFPIVFDNVLPVSDDQFVTTINTQVLYELYNNSILAYNIRTQRAPKICYKDGREAYKININRWSVKEIKELIERGLYIYNDLSFNVGGREENDFYYDEQNAKFVLRSGMFDILDGFHRTMAIIQVMNEDPEINLNFVLNIMNFSEEKARRFVAQQDKRNKINPSFSRSLDDTKYDSILTKRLNENSNSILFGQIKTVGKRQIDFGKTANAVKAFYNPKSMKEVNIAEKEITEGFASVFGDGFSDTIGDQEVKVAMAYTRYASGKYTRKGYEKLKTYISAHPGEGRHLSTIKRAARTMAGK